MRIWIITARFALLALAPYFFFGGQDIYIFGALPLWWAPFFLSRCPVKTICGTQGQCGTKVYDNASRALFGAIRAVISHRLKLLNDIMNDSISPQEFRLLAVIILSGLCANDRYCYPPELHAVEAVRILNRLLSAIDKPGEVK